LYICSKELAVERKPVMNMFGLIKKKLANERLKERHKNLSEKTFRLSSINNKLRDQNSLNTEEVL
jgi:hypothetical protein